MIRFLYFLFVPKYLHLNYINYTFVCIIVSVCPPMCVCVAMCLTVCNLASHSSVSVCLCVGMCMCALVPFGPEAFNPLNLIYR